MSYVSTVVLFTNTLDSDDELPSRAMEWLRERLDTAGIGQPGDLDGDHWGGSKQAQMGVYGGAYNYLDTQRFLDIVAAAPWECPENVVLVIDQEDDTDPVVRRLQACPREWKVLA